tara:strand:+ start:235 stop:522 length:288 start_codon:yes stop_codon:yes gene_type:complete
MMTITITLSVILGISIFVNINQLRKQESQAEYIEDLEKSNTNFYTHFEQLKSKLTEANSEIRNIDRLGAFESSDEVGTAFRLIKEVIEDLNKKVD